MNRIYITTSAAMVLGSLLFAGVAFAESERSGESESHMNATATIMLTSHMSDDSATSSEEHGKSEDNSGKGNDDERMSASSTPPDDRGEGMEHTSDTQMEDRGKSDDRMEDANHEQEQEMEREHASSTEEHSQGEEHRSRVASVVQELLRVADRLGGIGSDVREVAMHQASSSEEAMHAMDDLDSESGIKKFLFGPNYRSLGDLRSSLETTQQSIERLTQASERTTDASVKADIEVQVQALLDVASTTQAYIQTHENVFSLFGWFVRIFSR